ncbi:MAG: glutaminyl-peptide cyclotransferase [Pirellulaceae bacterium]|nr:glutaminyl-peptide cyclotransferase [Planctomycetaceae bacterium]
MSRRRLLLAVVLFVVVSTACGMWAASQGDGRPQRYRYRVTKSFPHDRTAYCQGLLVHNGRLLEGTGKYAESSLREVNLATGKVSVRVDLPNNVFGEGIAVAGDRLLQLSWKRGLAFEYDVRKLEPTGRQFAYKGQGWGLTHDGTKWIMSDGTSVLRFHHTDTFEEIGRVTVVNEGRRVINLNELEFIDGQVFANIWKQDVIVKIDIKDGRVTGIVDLRGLYRSGRRRSDDVLNGIAYDTAQKRLYVTGKNWPRLYEIKLVKKSDR